MEDGQSPTRGTGRLRLVLPQAEIVRETGTSPYTSDPLSSLLCGPPNCPWCFDEVATFGDTCDLACYRSWHWWTESLTNGMNDAIVVLPTDVEAPNSIELQPWYEKEIDTELM